jgi:xanthine dehydrogenase accessory factor
VSAGEQLGTIDGSPLASQIGGVVRGLLAEGVVSPGLKIADIDPRADRAACFEISDKSLAIGGGVLEAVLQWMNRSQ